MNLKRLMLAAVAVLAAGTASATELRILRQAGTASSQPLQLIWLNLIPKYAAAEGITDLKITTINMANGLDANVALLANQMDVAVTATTAYAALRSKTADAKMISTVGAYDWWLTCRPSIRRFTDIKPNDKIAMKGLNSSEQLFIQQLAADQLVDAHKLDPNLVVLPRPQALQLLASDSPDIACAVLGSPMQAAAVKAGANIVAVSNNAEVQGSIIVSYAMKSWTDANPKLVKALRDAEAEAIEIYAKYPLGAMAKFKEVDQLQDSAEELVLVAKQTHQTWSMDPKAFNLRDHLRALGLKDWDYGDMLQ